LLFIGLGNPGTEYHETRHNAGFMVLDTISKKISLKFKKPIFKNYLIARGFYQGKEIVLIKPMTYMNKSGSVFNYIPKKYLNYPLVVICDNMDLAPGECRVKRKGCNSGHNGMNSIIASFGSQEFLRVYVGIARPLSGETVISHVLGKPGELDLSDFKKGIERAANAVVSLLTINVQRVMNEYNRRNT
jgi:PTH1 family peptidyl-tRNA hydrolase